MIIAFSSSFGSSKVMLSGMESIVTQTINNLPTMQETLVQSLGQEAPLEKEMAIHSNITAWRIPWTEEPGRRQFHGVSKELDTTEWLTLSLSPAHKYDKYFFASSWLHVPAQTISVLWNTSGLCLRYLFSPVTEDIRGISGFMVMLCPSVTVSTSVLSGKLVILS